MMTTRRIEDVETHYVAALRHLGAVHAHLNVPDVMAALVKDIREGRLHRGYVVLLRDQLAQALQRAEQ